jgi:hypothetical protein
MRIVEPTVFLETFASAFVNNGLVDVLDVWNDNWMEVCHRGDKSCVMNQRGIFRESLEHT